MLEYVWLKKQQNNSPSGSQQNIVTNNIPIQHLIYILWMNLLRSTIKYLLEIVKLS